MVERKLLYLFLIVLGLSISCSSLSDLSFLQTPTPTPTHTLVPTQTPKPTQTPFPTQSLPHPIVRGSRLSFDGVDDWVVIDDSSDLEIGLGDFTISVWFKTNKLGTQQQIIRKGYDHRVEGEGRWVLSIDASGVIRIVVNDIEYPGSLEASGTTIVTDGRWHHVAAVFDRDQSLNVYLDGIIEIQDPSLTLLSNSIHNKSIVKVYIGRAHSSGLYFEGMLDDIALWNDARTQTEIKADQTRELQIQDEHLIVYWGMQEGQGQTLLDSAGDHHGQLGSTQGEDINDPTWYYPQ